MIVGVEEIPQLQPAACSFSGHGSGSAKKFIRIVNPDVFTDTLLISDHFFKQMADEMGFVEVDTNSKLLKELQDRINELAPTVHSFLSELGLLRQRFDNLQALEANILQLKSTMDGLVGIVESPESTIKPDTSKHPSRVSSSSGKSATVVDLFD